MPMPLHFVCLPGLDGSGEFFDGLKQHLPNDVTCTIVSYPHQQCDTFEDYVQYVCKQLPRQGRIVLIAESFSGPIGVAVAATRPKELVALVLCATFIKNPQPLLKWILPVIRRYPIRWVPVHLFAWLLLGPKHLTVDWIKRIRDSLYSCPEAVLKDRVAMVFNNDVTQLVNKVNVPMLYLQATKDWIVPKRATHELRQLVRDMVVETIDAHHFVLQTQPKQSVEMIQQWLRGL